MKKCLFSSEERPMPQPKASATKKTPAAQTATGKSDDHQIKEKAEIFKVQADGHVHLGDPVQEAALYIQDAWDGVAEEHPTNTPRAWVAFAWRLRTPRSKCLN